jgi:hypothetical protein
VFRFHIAAVVCDMLSLIPHADPTGISTQRRTNVKILMELTSHNQLATTGRPTGFWLGKFAAPYFVFRDAGVELTLACPKGRQPPLDPNSDVPENQTPAMAQFKKERAAQKALANTVAGFTNGEERDAAYEGCAFPGRRRTALARCSIREDGELARIVARNEAIRED